MKMAFIFGFKIVLMCLKSVFDTLVCQSAYSSMAILGQEDNDRACASVCLCVCRSERATKKGWAEDMDGSVQIQSHH